MDYDTVMRDRRIQSEMSGRGGVNSRNDDARETPVLLSFPILILTGAVFLLPQLSFGQNSLQRRKDLQTFEEQYRKARDEFLKEIRLLAEYSLGEGAGPILSICYDSPGHYDPDYDVRNQDV